MGLSEVDAFWRRFFDVPEERWASPGIHVVEHARLRDWSGVWFFARPHGCIVAAPRARCAELEAHARRGAIETTLPDEARVRRILGDDVTAIIGPAYHGYLAAAPGVPAASEASLADLPPTDPRVRALRDDCDAEAWAHSGLDHAAAPWCAAIDAGRVVALAALRELEPGAADVCVITRPDARGRGLGKRAVSGAIARRAPDVEVLYQTLEDNRAAVGIAEALGFERYARKLAVRLRPPDP